MPPRNARSTGREIPRRFIEKVEVRSDGCWIWSAALRGDGYPTFWFEGRQVGAHRFAAEARFGAIPAGMVVDHLCRVRACVNPDHLEVVDAAENLRRRKLPRGADTFQGSKTACPHGHPYTPGNTIHRADGARVCRACRRAYRRRYRRSLAEKGVQIAAS